MTDSLEFQKLRRRLFISVITWRTLSPTTQSPMYRRIVSHGLDYTTHFQLVGETFLSAILVAINVPPQVTTAKRAERTGRVRVLGMEVSFGEMPNYKSTFDVGGYLLYNDFMNSERGIMPKPEEEVESAVEVGLPRAGRVRQSVLRSAFERRL